MTTDISAEKLVLGTNVFGWTATAEQSGEILSRFAELGGRHIDTADSYSEWSEGNPGGVAESILGEWLQGVDRSEFIVATKVGQYSRRPGLAEENILHALDESLERLGTDYLDLYYAHADDPSVALEDVARTFSVLVDQGRIRRIGISNFSGARVREWLDIAEQRGFHRPTVVQPLYNLVQREAYETELAPTVAEYGLDVFTYASLARGFLTGKYHGDADLRGGARDGQVAGFLTEENADLVRRLTAIADAHGVSTAAAALAWLFSRPQIAGTIASVSRPDQLDALLGFDRPEVQEAVAQLV